MTLFPRRLLTRLRHRLERRRAIVLTGARQTGKTTLARDLLAPDAGARVEYHSLDDPDERIRIAADPVRAVERTDGLVVLDEIQKLPALFDAVKLVVDRPGRSRFLLLGSSRVLLLKQVQETLAGRTAVLDLWPLAVGERLGGRDTLLDRIWDEGRAALRGTDPSADAARRMRGIAEETLAWGGYPPVGAFSDDTDRREWLRDYRRTFLERDLADLGRVEDLDQFARAQIWVAARTGEFLSYSELARDLGVAVNTAKRYVRFLEISYQVALIEPFLPRVDRRLAKSPKVLWTDTGLARVLNGRGALDDGPLYETFVGTELIKWCSWRDDAPGLYSFRVHGGMEVDLVLASPDTILAIECKASTRLHESRARWLRRFLDEAGRGAKRRLGLLVYRGREVAELDRDVWAVPDWLLLSPYTIAND